MTRREAALKELKKGTHYCKGDESPLDTAPHLEAPENAVAQKVVVVRDKWRGLF